MPDWTGAMGSRGKVLSKEGPWSDLGFIRISAAREVSEWGRETGDRGTGGRLGHVCWSGCENCGDRRGQTKI